MCKKSQLVIFLFYDVVNNKGMIRRSAVLAIPKRPEVDNDDVEQTEFSVGDTVEVNVTVRDVIHHLVFMIQI
ncbi:hypothetical protein [Pseudogracilibacillus sp. SO30301A]|uniref:hypothetical protein n=1 Tax=Pseudogracilibacillus sp. SO30301A TaxID=3098291 RepID=UPI00300E1DD0